MIGQRWITYEHRTLRLRPEGPLAPRACQAFLSLIPQLPVGALSATADGIRVGSHCGLIQVDGWLLEILPKIYGEATEGPNRGLLVKMLGHCFDLPVWQQGLADAEWADDLLTIVIQAFLTEAAMQMRHGLLKSYVHCEEQLARPRGRLNLSRQIRRGRAQAHRMHCEFDELTADNGYNQAVRAALQVVQTLLPRGSAIKARADRLLGQVMEISPAAMMPSDIESLPRNRLTEHYDRLLLLATWILQLAGPDVHSGNGQGLSLLFDMNQLFQRYVGVMLQAAVHRHSGCHRVQLTKEWPQIGLLRDETNGASCFRMKPDFTLRLQNGLFIAILDTKWKVLAPDDAVGHYGIAQSDLYQLLAYGHSYDCQQLVLIYPSHPKAKDWNTRHYRYAPHDDPSRRLAVTVFDIDETEGSAERLLGELLEARTRPSSRILA